KARKVWLHCRRTQRLAELVLAIFSGEGAPEVPLQIRRRTQRCSRSLARHLRTSNRAAGVCRNLTVTTAPNLRIARAAQSMATNGRFGGLGAERRRASLELQSPPAWRVCSKHFAGEGHMPRAKTVYELLAQAAKQQNEHVALSQAGQLLANVPISPLGELQAKRPPRAPGRRTHLTRRENESMTAR